MQNTMKKTMLCTLLGLGMIFGSSSALLAENPAGTLSLPTAGDTTSLTVPADTLAAPAALPTPPATRIKTDSLLTALGDRVADLEQTVRQIRNAAYDRARTDLNGDHVAAVLIVALVMAALVIVVFISQKSRYRRREKEYELERLRIERGEQLPADIRTELPVTVFIRRLLIVAICGFALLAWVGVVNTGYIRFFSGLLLWALIAGVGYAVIYLFRLYVQRRDDNR